MWKLSSTYNINNMYIIVIAGEQNIKLSLGKRDNLYYCSFKIVIHMFLRLYNSFGP